MEILNPRRILALGPPESGVLHPLDALTGSAPSPTDTSIAGLSHAWTIKTAYYSAIIPIWIDEILSISEWAAEFSKPEAKEVVKVIGGWIYCFRKPITETDADLIKRTMEAIQLIIEKGAGYGWDGICLAVAMPQSTTPCLEKGVEEWEDECRERGFEYVDSEAKGKNEFGEIQGIARVNEALEANEWAGDDFEDLDDFNAFDEDELGDFQGSFAAEEVEMEMEFMGVKTAIHNMDEAKLYSDKEGKLKEEDEAQQIEELEYMMQKLQTIKDTSADMPETDRRKFAVKAVSDVLKKL